MKMNTTQPRQLELALGNRTSFGHIPGRARNRRLRKASPERAAWWFARIREWTMDSPNNTSLDSTEGRAAA